MKKSIISLILFAFISSSVFSQQNSYASERCYKVGKRFRKIGIITGVPGLALLGGGLALGITQGGFYYQVSYSSYGGGYEYGTPLMGLAGLMVGLGTVATVTGVVFSIIGTKKLASCKKKYAFYPTPYGLGFCYRY